MTLIQVPTLKAMVLADQVYTDGSSGKRIICGTFSRLHVANIPGTFRKVTYAFILLSDAIGKFSLQIRFVHLRDNKILLQSQPVPLESNDPLRTLDIVMAIPPLPIVTEGFYSLECWVESHLVGSVRLEVVKKSGERD